MGNNSPPLPAGPAPVMNINADTRRTLSIGCYANVAASETLLVVCHRLCGRFTAAWKQDEFGLFFSLFATLCCTCSTRWRMTPPDPPESAHECRTRPLLAVATWSSTGGGQKIDLWSTMRETTRVIQLCSCSRAHLNILIDIRQVFNNKSFSVRKRWRRSPVPSLIISE